MSPAPASPAPWIARLSAVLVKLANLRTDVRGELWNVRHAAGVEPAGLHALAERADEVRYEIAGLKADAARPHGAAGALDRAAKLIPAGRGSPLARAARAGSALAARADITDAAVRVHLALMLITDLVPEADRVWAAPPAGVAQPAEARPPAPAPPSPADRAVLVVELAGFRRLVAGLIAAYDSASDREQRAYVVDFYQGWFEHFVWDALGGATDAPQRVFATLGPVTCLVFRTAPEALRFVRAVAERAVAHNRTEEPDGLNAFRFRFALGWGRVRFRTPVAAAVNPEYPYSVAVGEPVLAAHVLGPQARTGELLIHVDAFDELVRTNELVAGALGAAVPFPGAAGDPPCDAYRCPVP